MFVLATYFTGFNLMITEPRNCNLGCMHSIVCKYKATICPDLQKPDIIAHFVFREIPTLNIQYAVTT